MLARILSIGLAVSVLPMPQRPTFDLIFAMSGVGPGFATDVPGIFVFEQTFKATRYNLGAAASVVMLLLVSAVIVPYLARSLRED